METDTTTVNPAADPDGPPLEDPVKKTSTTDDTSQTFPQFALLPAELRLLIWTAATDQRTQDPRVVNMFVGGPFEWRRRRMHITNLLWLQARDGANNVLGTSTEARAAARRYLEPQRGVQSPLVSLHQTCSVIWARRIQDLGGPLVRLRVDPTWDILFLNGMDIHAANRTANIDAAAQGEGQCDSAGVPALLPHFPPRVSSRAIRHREPWRGDHSLGLWGLEAEILSQFRTIIMPVQGLVEPPPEGRSLPRTFTDPFVGWSFDWPGGPPGTPGDMDKDRTFIALLGGPYRGRNLQMEDIELISEAEIDAIRYEAAQGGDPGRAGSTVQRDVVVMTAVWECWTHRLQVFRDADLQRFAADNPNMAPSVLGTLRFARIKQGVCEALTEEDIFVTEKMPEQQAGEGEASAAPGT